VEEALGASQAPVDEADNRDVTPRPHAGRHLQWGMRLKAHRDTDLAEGLVVRELGVPELKVRDETGR
jgi:hypothetical protein